MSIEYVYITTQGKHLQLDESLMFLIQTIHYIYYNLVVYYKVQKVHKVQKKEKNKVAPKGYFSRFSRQDKPLSCLIVLTRLAGKIFRRNKD